MRCECEGLREFVFLCVFLSAFLCVCVCFRSVFLIVFLSDLLFVVARSIARLQATEEVLWAPKPKPEA